MEGRGIAARVALLFAAAGCGDGIEDLYTGAPERMRVDETSLYLQFGNGIYRIDKDRASTPDDAIALVRDPDNLYESITGIALDDVYVYWAAIEYAPGADSPLEEGERRFIIKRTNKRALSAPVALYESLREPRELMVDRNEIFWFEYSANLNPASGIARSRAEVFRAAADGSAGPTSVWEHDDVTMYALAADAERIYWGYDNDSPSVVLSATRATGIVEPVVTLPDFEPIYALTTTDEGPYWLHGECVERFIVATGEVSGCIAEVPVERIAQATSLTVDSAGIFALGYRVAPDGGSFSRFMPHWALHVADDDYIYGMGYFDDAGYQHIKRREKGADSSEPVTDGAHPPVIGRRAGGGVAVDSRDSVRSVR